MGRLVAHTLVASPELSGQGYQTFGPADGDIPEWAARQMGAHLFEGGEHPFPDDPEDTSARVDGEPPRKGPKASRDAWVEFAKSKGYNPPDETKQSDIIAYLVAQEVISA